MALIQGPVSKQYISSLNFLDKRDYLAEVMDIANEEATIVDAMTLTGRMEITDVPTFTHVENSYLFNSATYATTTSGGTNVAGAQIVITITAGTNNALPIVGELAMFAAYKSSTTPKIGLVTAVVTATLTVTILPLLATDGYLTATIAATPQIIFFSGAYGEGTGDPNTRQPLFVQSQNTIQIFKEAGEITDLQKVSAVEVKYNGQNHLMYKVQHDALLRLKMKMSNAFLYGQKSISTDANGIPVYTTQGLKPYIFGGDGSIKTTGGVTKQLSATILKTDLKAFSRALDRAQAPKEYWGYIGGDLSADLDDLIASFDGVKYSVSFGSFGQGNPAKRAVDLGFDSYRIYNRTWHLNRLSLLDHQGLFGATNFDYSKEGYFIPTDKIKIDAGGGVTDRILLRHMSGDGTNFAPYMETVTGKLAPTPTNTTSVLHISYQAIAGLQVCGNNHFGCIYWT